MSGLRCDSCDDAELCEAGMIPCPQMDPRDFIEPAKAGKENDMAEGTNESRVRINLSQSAKGAIQFDITSEFPNEDESVLHLGAAIDKVKELCAEKGLKLAEAVV